MIVCTFVNGILDVNIIGTALVVAGVGIVTACVYIAVAFVVGIVLHR